MVAAKLGYVGIVSKLIRHGATVNFTNRVRISVCLLQ